MILLEAVLRAYLHKKKVNSKAYLEPSRTSTMESFCESSS